MNRFLVPIGVFILLVIVLAVGIKRAPEKGEIKSPLLGKPAPEFVLPNLTGGAQVSSAALRGRWYLFNVWGTWCGACRDEHEMLMSLKARGAIPIIGLDWKDDDAKAIEWLSALGNPYEQVAADRDGRVAIDWGVYGAPETFLVSPEGIVVAKHVGALDEEVWKKKFLSRLPANASAGTAQAADAVVATTGAQ